MEGREGGGNGGPGGARARRPGTGGQTGCSTGVGAGFLYGSAAPWIRARHCRAKIGNAASPAMSLISENSRRHVSPLPRHHAWRDTGMAKNISFKKNRQC